VAHDVFVFAENLLGDIQHHWSSPQPLETKRNETENLKLKQEREQGGKKRET